METDLSSLSRIISYIYIHIDICTHTHQGLPFLYCIDYFIARSTICYICVLFVFLDKWKIANGWPRNEIVYVNIPMKEMKHFLNNITLIHPPSLRMCSNQVAIKELHGTCVVVCKSRKRLHNEINVFLLQIPRNKAQGRPWWGWGWPYVYIYMYIYVPGNPPDCFFLLCFKKTWFFAILNAKSALERFFPIRTLFYALEVFSLQND